MRTRRWRVVWAVALMVVGVVGLGALSGGDARARGLEPTILNCQPGQALCQYWICVGDAYNGYCTPGGDVCDGCTWTTTCNGCLHLIDCCP